MVNHPSQKKYLLQLPKEIIWSFFLSFYLFFPAANCLELVVYHKQNSSVCFFFSLGILLYLLFKWSSNFYDFTLDLFFSKPFRIYVDHMGKSAVFLKKHPRFLGMVYGFCLLSFYLQIEFPDSFFLKCVTVFFLVLRNALLFPYLGVNFLSSWIFQNFQHLVESEKCSERIFVFLKDEKSSFSEFDKHYFSSVSLIHSKKENYSYETRRTMFTFVRTAFSLPGKEQIPTVVRSTIGTTIAGSAAITAYTSGAQTDQLVRESHEKTTRICNEILSHSNSTPTQKNLASQLKSKMESAREDWFFEAGANTGVRGAKILFSEPTTMRLKNQVQDLSFQATKLREISESHGEVAEMKLSQFIKRNNYTNFTAPSGLESSVFDDLVEKFYRALFF